MEFVQDALFLLVCAGFSLNLILHFGLGIRETAESLEQSLPAPVFQTGVLAGSVFILWGICSYLLPILSFGFLEYFLLYPMSALLCLALEAGAIKFAPGLVPRSKIFPALSGYNGLVPSGLWLTLHLAGTPLEALILSAGFGGGVLFALVLLEYIRKRSALESVPRNLRGRPLLLITMGLLSLVTASLTVVFFRIVGIF
ncbi:MAG: hypothetical protein LBG90_02210 [Spirochaetaceae bacterium]|nr:hypothetical protein [Spirochaetaceae bacterium]